MSRTVERPIKVAGMILLVMVIICASGDAAGITPTISSIKHKTFAGGDSIKLISDYPFPKEFLSSSNGSVTLEFARMGCAIPLDTGGKFATTVDGNLVDRVDIQVDGKPPSTVLEFKIKGSQNYTYTVLKNSPQELEVIFSTTGTNLVSSSVSKPVAPQMQTLASLKKPLLQSPKPVETSIPEIPVCVIEPPEIGSAMTLSNEDPVISKVKYYELKDGGDRIEFMGEGQPLPIPSTRRMYYPPRIEVRFPATTVQLPPDAGQGVFSTNVAGRFAEVLRVWNPETAGEDCVFQIQIKPGEKVQWEIAPTTGNRVALNIEPLMQFDGPPPDWTKLFTFEDDYTYQANRYTDRVSSKPKPPLSVNTEVVDRLPEITLELDWPAQKDALIDQINIITSKYGAGQVIDLPIALKLKMDGASPSPLGYK